MFRIKKARARYQPNELINLGKRGSTHLYAQSHELARRQPPIYFTLSPAYQEKSPLLICSEQGVDKKFGGANKSWLSTMEPRAENARQTPNLGGHLFLPAAWNIFFVLFARTTASHDTSNQ